MVWWLRKQFLRLKLYLSSNYEGERESLIIWYAVCYALGAAIYLTMPIEISVWAVLGLLELVLILLYLTRNKSGLFQFLTYVTILILGICIAKADALYQKTKIENNINEISYLYGKIDKIDENYKGYKRLIISHADDDEHQLKGKYKITLRQNPDWLKVGTCVEMIAKFPSEYPKNPLSNYDKERADFYQNISASGYVISPVFQADCVMDEHYLNNKINEIKSKINNLVEQYATPTTKGVIKALTIGQRTDIPNQLVANYRLSGLAHLLAISGMHMGMIALVAFFLIRLLFSPLGQGRYDLRKLAAVISLILTLGYFLISGQSISCIRAFIMTSLVLCAILLNRRAISLRLWAFALFIVVTIDPSAVISPGFLMSFAAVLGIVAFYEAYALSIRQWYATQTMYAKLKVYLLGIVLTDLVASLITLPFSLYYFHQISVYTTLANILAGPIVAFWVMPAILFFLISIPIGLAPYSLKILSSGVSVVNNIASWVATLKGADMAQDIELFPNTGLFLITIGLLWLCIWQQRWRYLGLIAIILGLMNFLFYPRADFVFDAKGETFACRNNENKLVKTKWHKNKFLTAMWTNGAEDTSSQIECNKQECTCQGKINFSAHKVIYNKKAIKLDKSGYIDIKRGVFYTPKKEGRLWHKK